MIEFSLESCHTCISKTLVQTHTHKQSHTKKQHVYKGNAFVIEPVPRRPSSLLTYLHSHKIQHLYISTGRKAPTHTSTHTPAKSHKQHWRREKPATISKNESVLPQGWTLPPTKIVSAREAEEPDLVRSRDATNWAPAKVLSHKSTCYELIMMTCGKGKRRKEVMMPIVFLFCSLSMEY